MNAITSFFLVFLAYTPLWLMVAIRDLNSVLVGSRQNLVAEWTGLGIIAVCWVVGFIRVCLASCKDFTVWAKSPETFKIVSCKEHKTVAVSFVVTNILPVFIIDPTTADGFFLILAYFLVVASIAVKHRHFPANVVIEWLGWTFCECTIETVKGGIARTEMVLSRDYLGGTNQFRTLMKLNNETFVAITREEGK